MKPGDLVRVAYGMPCCGHTTGAEGMIFIITQIRPRIKPGKCYYCKTPFPVGSPPAAKGLTGRRPIGITRLVLIPPLQELESIEHKEELVT